MILRENPKNYLNSNSNSLSDQSAACNKVIAQGGGTVLVVAPLFCCCCAVSHRPLSLLRLVAHVVLAGWLAVWLAGKSTISATRDQQEGPYGDSLATYGSWSFPRDLFSQLSSPSPSQLRHIFSLRMQKMQCRKRPQQPSLAKPTFRTYSPPTNTFQGTSIQPL